MRKECVRHVQKWLQIRLRTLQRTLRGKILSDGKKIPCNRDGFKTRKFHNFTDIIYFQ